MLLKKVEAGKVYLTLRYSRESIWPPRSGADWERIASRGYPLKVIETPVDVPGYTRRGVLGQELDPHTMAPRAYEHSGVVEPSRLMAVSLVMPWEDFYRQYHEYLDASEQDAVERAERRRLDQERRQEEAAKRWMADQFKRARIDIVEVCEVVNGEPGRTASDDEVRALVTLRNPNGNPYLNGERTAH